MDKRTQERKCCHCRNQYICIVKERADGLFRHANMVMGEKSDDLFVMLTQGIAKACARWEGIED